MAPCSVCLSRGKKTKSHFDDVIHYRIRTDIILGAEAVVEEKDQEAFKQALISLFEDWTTQWVPHKAVRIVAHLEKPFRFEREVTLKPGRGKVGGFYGQLSRLLNRYIKSWPGWPVPPNKDPKGGIHILENGGNGC